MVRNRIVPTQIKTERKDKLFIVSIEYRGARFVVCKVNNLIAAVEVRRALEKGVYSQQALHNLCYVPSPQPHIKDTSSPHRKKPVTKPILALINSRKGKPITTNQIATKLDICPKIVLQVVHRLILQKSIERMGLHDRYGYVSKGTMKHAKNIGCTILDYIREHPGITRRALFTELNIHIPPEAPILLTKMKKDGTLRYDSKGRHYANN